MEVAVQPAHPQFMVEVRDPSHAGEARRLAVHSAERLGLGESDRGALAIAVTELTTNILKHAQSGMVLCEPIVQNGSRGVRVLALDKGPGIGDVGKALEDGFSTCGTAGNGLGAVQRLSTRFDVYSVPQRGTCVLAEFWPKRKEPAPALPFQVGAVSLAMRRETVCGDGWKSRTRNGTSLLMVVDGLGHGSLAAEAAREAERIFEESSSTSPGSILQDCHDALRKTRGAAAAIAAISPDSRLLSFAGVGNISGTVITQGARRGMTSHNGTLGHQLHKIQEFTFPWEPDSVLVMHSDGLGSKWDLNQYPGIMRKHPSVIAALLYRDFERQRDDVTVLVAKNSE
ncbi:MAG TPA: ATP-binding SpoIIE family protein phosphatase [Candidatus Sulfotelmatobacter sp.]|nr:ATP-binding SpoIIE family protein phosphatase [Candidatus Sulfotelmatobacter sp.]